MCKLCKRQPGRCPTHSLTPEQLALRNSKAAAAFKANNPQGFTKQRKAAGRKGFQKLYSKDPSAAAEVLAKHRRNNPSNLIRKVVTWLQQPYELEVPIGPFYADIVVGGKVVVRVNGNIWHRPDPLHGRNPIERDAAEERHYLELGYSVITLWEDDINSGAARNILTENLVCSYQTAIPL